MVTIPGASQYINSATLANQRGQAAVAPTILDSSSSLETSLLDVARNLSVGGVGISGTARALNQQILNNSDYNTLLSLGAGTDATVEGLRQEILALRSKTSTSRLHSSVIAEETSIDSEAAAEEEERLANESRGNVVNTLA